MSLKYIKNATLLLSLLLVLFISPVQAQAPQPVVHAVMFWMAGCPHCEDVIANVLPPLREKYGTQFDLFMIEVKGQQDVDLIYRVAESYKLAKKQTGVPFLIIGDQVLVGSEQVREQLPVLIDEYLNRGGVDFSANPILTDLLPKPIPASALTSNLPAATQAAPSPKTDSAPIVQTRSNGFTLATGVMVFMVVAILYALFSLLTGKLYLQATWMDNAIPWTTLVGLFVAGYLTYVETQSVQAFCGPVGDCNAVQSSSYARIWGILPIGVLGAFGYIAILAAWWIGKNRWGWLSAYAPIALYGMALFGTIFSVYLTYLELFVIKAVCIWCISSAIIITLLLWLSLSSTLRAFRLSVILDNPS
jgi:uncharacterized membrane protein/glutaredoxin